MLSEKQKQRLGTIAKVIDNGDVAILERIDQVEDDLTERVDGIEKQIPDVKKALDRVEALVDGEKGEKGDKGDTGERGPEGKQGKQGKDGKQGPKGERGEKGDPGRDGKDGKDGKDGRDGKDGFVDEATIAYLEDRINNIPKATLPSPIGIVVREVQAGSGVTIDNSNPLKPIVSASAPGGSGITRTVVVTSGNVVMGATASTDYTYLVAGAHTVTLPTAVGNTNRYTVKNNHSADITIDTTSSQTIDGTTSIQIAPEDSVDILSNNANWFVI